MKPQMIASDIGGTLTRGGGGIGDYTVDVLNALLKLGIPVSFLTGYNYHSAGRYLSRIGEDAVKIVQNGAAAVSGNKILWEHPLGEDDARFMVEAFQKWEVPVYVFRGSRTGFSNEIVSVDPVPQKRHFSHSGSIIDFFHILCVSIRGENRLLEKVMGEFPKSFGDRYHFILSRGPDISWLEVTDLNARKDLALKKLCRMLSIDIGEVMYFGDNLNDLEVLNAVGHPWVVPNGLPELKERFNALEFPSGEEGVARYLNRLFDLKIKRGAIR